MAGGYITRQSPLEAATLRGEKFTQIQEFIVSGQSPPLYVLYELPAGLDLTVELVKRAFKTDTAGAKMLILWDYDISNAVKTPLASFNENNDFRDKAAKFEVSLLNPSDLDPITGEMTITGPANVTSDGIVRESSFISATGSGRNTVGDVDPALSFRKYKSGTGYLFKVTSRAAANETDLVNIGYAWTETTA